MASPGQDTLATRDLNRAVPRRRAAARLRVAVLVLAALVLGGCVLRVAYNQLEWLSVWYVEDYFDLTEPQEKVVAGLIRRDLAWHRETQLPRYAELLEQLRAQAGEPVSPKFVAARYQDIIQLWDALLRQLGPGAAELLQMLSDEQVREFFEELADKNADLAEDYSGTTVEERRQKQSREIVRAFRRFIGPLNRSQQELVAERTAAMNDVTGQWLSRRETWQSALRTLLEQRRQDPAFAAALADLLLHPNQFDGPGYREAVQANQRIAFEMVAAVMSSLTPRQTTHLKGKLDDYLGDIRILIREGKREAPLPQKGPGPGAEERT